MESESQDPVVTRSKLLKELANLEDWALVSEFHVAAALNLSVGKIRNDRLVGVGVPYRKLGRKVAYVKSDIMDYLKGLVRHGPREAQAKMLEAA